MSFRRVIVAGAGLAGLSAAVELAKAGVPVSLSDSAPQAGGRCRSYYDPVVGLTIDNGNHLVLSGNAAVAAYRKTIGAKEPLIGPDHADFPFVDIDTGSRWTVMINDGRIPWWFLSKHRRVPGTGPADYLSLLRLLRGRQEPIGAAIEARGLLWDRLVAPVLLAALNTPPEEASAALAANVLHQSLARGGRATAPRIAHPSLAKTFVDPALVWLEQSGVRLTSGRRLRAMEFTDDAVTALVWSDGQEVVRSDEAVVLAVPAWVATALVPGLVAPDEHRAIINAHFAFPTTSDMPSMLGLLGGTAEWVFAHPDRISVTISAADSLIHLDRQELAVTLWGDVQRAFGIVSSLPRWQIVKEKRATFSATPRQDALRPGARTRWHNLFLAGDWVQNGLPATIEGALRSGDTAARLALGQPLLY